VCYCQIKLVLSEDARRWTLNIQIAAVQISYRIVNILKKAKTIYYASLLHFLVLRFDTKAVNNWLMSHKITVWPDQLSINIINNKKLGQSIKYC
jgi:hypothetical protein